MKLRAKQSTAINTPKGLVFVQGPEISTMDDVLSEGETIVVPDDFVVQPDVFEIVEPPAGKKPPRLAKTREQLIAEREAQRASGQFGATAPALPAPVPPTDDDGDGADGNSKAAGGKGKSKTAGGAD